MQSVHLAARAPLLIVAITAFILLAVQSARAADAPAAPARPEPLSGFSIGAAAPGEGTFICNCDPAGAEVYLDGAPLGESPVRKERIKEGGHVLTLKKPGYETLTDKMTMKKDVTLTVEEKMAEACGEILVDSEPRGADVSLDGSPAGNTPVTLKRVAGGRHTVLVRRDYFEPREFKVGLGVAERKELYAGLKRRLLFVGLSDGARPYGMGQELTDLASEMQSKMTGFSVIPLGMDELARKLSARGLDPAGLDFMRRQKARLGLEDVAVLSGVLEQEGAELALVAILHKDGAGSSLKLALYSRAGDTCDKTVIVLDGSHDLWTLFNEYLAKWTRQEKSVCPSMGASLAARPGPGL